MRARYSIKSYLSRRSKNNKRQIFRLDNIIKDGADSSFTELLVDDSGNPSNTTECREYESFILRKLESMVNKGILSERGLKYIKMFYLDGLSVTEIASKEGVTRQAVHETMSRTMKLIKSQLILGV